MSDQSESIKRPSIVTAVLVPELGFSLSRGILIPVLPEFAAEFTNAYGTIGAILSAEAFGQVALNVPSGFIVRRWGIRQTMLVGMLLVIAATLATASSQTLWQLAISRVAAGFGMSLFSIARHTFLAQYIDVEQRGRTSSWLGGIHRAGNFIGPALGGFVAIRWGLRWPFAILVICVLAGLIAAESATRQIRYNDQGSDQLEHRFLVAVRSEFAFLLQTMRTYRKRLAVAGTAQLLGQATRVGRQVILPLYAADVLGLSVQDTGLIISIGFGVDMSLFFVSGILMDRFGRKYAIVPSFALQALALAFIPFTTGFIPLLIVSVMIGASNGISAGTMLTLGADLTPRDASRGHFLGVWNLIGDGGGLIAPLLIGFIAQTITLATSAFALCGIGLSAAAIFAFFVPETLKKEK